MTGTLPWFRSKGRDPGNEIALESYVCDIAPDDQSQGVKIRIPQRKLQDLDWGCFLLGETISSIINFG